jgi:cobalt-zinc-cadmium efflux system outer membrane protein
VSKLLILDAKFQLEGKINNYGLFCGCFPRCVGANYNPRYSWSDCQNNKSIKATTAYFDAEKMELKTGLNPDDYFLEADYIIGRPVQGGNQLDFNAVQSFDFPSVYSRRRAVADKKSNVFDAQSNLNRMRILLEAHSICINGIHLNRKVQVLEERKDRSKTIVRVLSH